MGKESWFAFHNHENRKKLESLSLKVLLKEISIDDIAEEYGCSCATVYTVLKQGGFSNKLGRAYSKDRDEEYRLNEVLKNWGEKNIAKNILSEYLKKDLEVS